MPQPFRVLYIGPAKSEAFDTSSLEQQSRAIRLAGGTLVRYEGSDSAALAQALRDVDVAMVQGHGFDHTAFAHMGLHGRCKGLVSFGHGFDHLDLDAATRNGVILANTASFGTEEVSNHTMMHFLVCSRKFVLHDKLVRSGTWTRKNLGPMGHVARSGLRHRRPRRHRPRGGAQGQGVRPAGHRLRPVRRLLGRPGVRRRDDRIAGRAVPALRLRQRPHLSQLRRRATSSAARSSQ